MKPNPVPATLPKAKCGNRAVRPETGYIQPTSSCTSARMTILTRARPEATSAEVPVEYEAFHEPNSQPEPMIDVTDAQQAPISHISRFRPISLGLVVATTAGSVAMSEPPSGPHSWGDCPVTRTPASDWLEG